MYAGIYMSFSSNDTCTKLIILRRGRFLLMLLTNINNYAHIQLDFLRPVWWVTHIGMIY